MEILFLVLSVICGSARGVFLKKINTDALNRKRFYTDLCILFLSGGVAIFLFDVTALTSITTITIMCAVTFGITTFVAQSCFSIALGKGPTSICSMVYSFGFIFPTILGAICWGEDFGIFSQIGFIIALSAIIVSAFSSGKTTKSGSGFILPNLVAMAASGGLGIIQKVHQSSSDKQNLNAFLVLAFILAAAIALMFALFSKGGDDNKQKLSVYNVLAGLCFGMASMLNTMLAGMLPSAIMFPTLNIGVMVLSLIAGVIIFKEKPTKSQKIAFALGIVAIIVLSLSK